MFKRKVSSHDKISIRVTDLDQVEEQIYQGAFVSQAGREYDFSWDREVGLLWLHDAAKSFQPEDSFWKSASPLLKSHIEDYENTEQIIHSISSKQSLAIPAKRRLAKGSKREIGISKATGFTAYFSLDQTRFLAYYKRDNGPVNQTPDEMNMKIISRRAAGDDRKFVAIVEGLQGTLEYYRDKLTEPDYILYISDAKTLRGMGIRPIDQSWSRDVEQIDLNQVLATRFRAKTKKALNFMEENEILDDNRAVETDDRIPEKVIDDVQNFVNKKAPTIDVDDAIGLGPTRDTITQTETTELVDIVRRQQISSSIELEADFEKYSEPDEDEDEVIAKEAIRFLSGEEVEVEDEEQEDSSSDELKVGQRISDSMTGDRGKVIKVEGNKVHVKFDDSDEVTVLPTFMVK